MTEPVPRRLISAVAGVVPEELRTHPERRAMIEHLALVALLRQHGGRFDFAAGTPAEIDALMAPTVLLRGGEGRLWLELVDAAIDETGTDDPSRPPRTPPCG
jgi:hypothetical protein